MLLLRIGEVPELEDVICFPAPFRAPRLSLASSPLPMPLPSTVRLVPSAERDLFLKERRFRALEKEPRSWMTYGTALFSSIEQYRPVVDQMSDAVSRVRAWVMDVE